MSKEAGLNNIIISGKMASGKTTAADYLVLRYGYHKKSLADPIKIIERALDNYDNKTIVKQCLPNVKLNEHEKEIFFKILDTARTIEREFPKPRKRLQFIGTEGVRKQIRDTFWLEVISSNIKKDEHVVIDDVRFLNEYQYFVNLGFIALKIKITQKVQHARLLQLYGPYDKSILSHTSELDSEKILNLDNNHVISNSHNSLPKFQNSINNFMEKIYGKE